MKAKTKITKDDMLKIERTVRREIEIEFNLRVNYNKVEKNQKAYNRQKSKKISNFY
jgi:hypothetical protein